MVSIAVAKQQKVSLGASFNLNDTAGDPFNLNHFIDPHGEIVVWTTADR